MPHGYADQAMVELHRLSVVDATATGECTHNDMTRVRCSGEGRWSSPAATLDQVRVIEGAAA
jgi:hypothetical protein